MQHGPRITAIIVYLYVGQFLSKKRTAAALAELFGTPVSEGTVATMTTRAANGLNGRIGFIPFQTDPADVYRMLDVVVHASVRPEPFGLTIVEAASIWMQYFTALAIYEVGHAAPGDFVMIRAASSSVGLAAIQLANWAGAEPIALTRRSNKSAALTAHGAKHVIATEETDLVAEVNRITSDAGARIVFDPVGGPDVETLAQATAEEGIIIIYGGLSGQPTPYPHWAAALKGLSLRGWVASAIWNKPLRFARYRDLIRRGLEQGHLKPVIAKTFPLVQIEAAHRYLESNQHVGKVVLTV